MRIIDRKVALGIEMKLGFQDLVNSESIKHLYPEIIRAMHFFAKSTLEDKMAREIYLASLEYFYDEGMLDILENRSAREINITGINFNFHKSSYYDMLEPKYNRDYDEYSYNISSVIGFYARNFLIELAYKYPSIISDKTKQFINYIESFNIEEPYNGQF